MNSLEKSRRDIMKMTALGAIAGGLVSRTDKVAAMQGAAAPGRTITAALKAMPKNSEALLLPARYGGVDQPPKPATTDMLPLSWHKSRMKALFAKAAERGVQSLLLRSPENVTYYTGYSYSNTERPQATFINKDDGAPWYFHPMVDDQLVRSGWFDGGQRVFFDFPHAAGGFPNQGKVVTSPGIDLMSFMLEGIRDRGVQGTKIGLDGELYPSEMAKFRKILPKVEIVDIGDLILEMRMVKTPEELALWSRAYSYHDRVQAFARDYLLTYGTDITDLELKMASELWLRDTLYSELDLAGGAPNHGVGSIGEVEVRSGPVNAYPHPNQPYYSQVLRDAPLQVVSYIMVGLCGGENYRMYQIADQSGRFDPHGTRLWEVSQHCCDIQRDMQKAGAVCGDIAYAIHKYQVDNGMKDYIYTRAAHGQTTEGHMPPFIALGDRTVLPKNSVMSEEPGLYDPVNKVGYNWSDSIVTGEASGYRMSRTPYSKEWLFVRL
ncbi:aminopeptidase P family N-terminal domain-containing protein [Rhizorhabdus histidinilytica]|uniref:Xaa-Pro aminopeptidase n=1 Tax=Rhizorhabdus histidinilytica TaxID=439228 RepID=A0A1T5B7Z6_9SPHN|nr:aminopeptidase P family N-terminal domain-containing protein [Rhizorhabdus histidinilytica]SKB43391.1 Xaa-Pro aminopeptidase [Rhizorhabdus histidinilytica]